MGAEFLMASRAVDILIQSILITAFVVVGYSRIMPIVSVFAIQSVALAGLAVYVAYYTEAAHIYIVAFLMLLFKVGIIPYSLRKIIRKLNIKREIEPVVSIPSSLLAATVMTMLTYSLVQGLSGIGTQFAKNALSVSLSVVLIGFFVMISRRKAVTQIIGLLVMENGVFLAGICLTFGMPLIVELGVFFDVLVSVLILGIFSYKIRHTFDSVDTDVLRELKG